MKVIIAGSRSIDDPQWVSWVEKAVKEAAVHGIVPTEVVSGGARGADTLGEKWAESQGLPVKRFLPNWDTDGKAAGLIRNIEMAKYADALVAIWDGTSRGTSHMIKTAEKMGLKVYVVYLGG